jgi:hypothetical protein
MAKTKTKSIKQRKFSLNHLVVTALVFGLVGGLIGWAAFAAPHNGGGGGSGGGSCTITPSTVGLDEVWTVSAGGLPASGVNQRITFPDGALSTGPITVGANGTFTTTGNSNMSASWGFISPEQKGTYSYQYVNRIKYPAGTYTKQYASCSVVVN